MTIFANLANLQWQQVVMWAIGALLIYLAIKKEMEPALLLPMGFGAILVNLPMSGAVTQVYEGVAEAGALDILFGAGIANELFPLLLFIGIGAMIDFEPLLQNPKLMLFGAAAQFGIFFTFAMAALFGFDIRDAASIAVIGAADGPTGIFVANFLNGFLMFGNLLRECGVLDALSETAQKVLANLITLLLGITVASKMTADAFLNWQTLMILGLGLVAFIFDTVGGILCAKLLNLFCKNKINPMIGAAGISAFPMSARVVHKMGLAEDNQNFLLMHAVGVNVSGQIASVIAGGMILGFFG